MSDYKYCWGFTRHKMTNFSDSIDECIKEAKEMKGLDFVPRFIYIGEGKTYQPNIGFGYHILECYGEEAEYICFDGKYISMETDSGLELFFKPDEIKEIEEVEE